MGLPIKGQGRLADWVGKQQIRLVNRTGTELQKGYIVQLDLAGSDGDVDVYATYAADTSPDPKASPLANCIEPTTAQIAVGGVWAVCEDTDVADNELFTATVRGLTEVYLADSDTSSVAINTGFSPTNAEPYGSAAADGTVTVGWALKANNSTAAGNVPALFDGIQFSTTGG